MKERGYADLVAILQEPRFARDITRYQSVKETGSQPYIKMPPFTHHNGCWWSSYNAHPYRLCHDKYPDACRWGGQKRRFQTLIHMHVQHGVVSKAAFHNIRQCIASGVQPLSNGSVIAFCAPALKSFWCAWPLSFKEAGLQLPTTSTAITVTGTAGWHHAMLAAAPAG